MTTLGIEFTDREPVLGWDAVSSAHKRYLPPRLAELREQIDATWKAHNEAIERGDKDEVARLGDEAVAQEAEYELAYRDHYRLASIQRRMIEQGAPSTGSSPSNAA